MANTYLQLPKKMYTIINQEPLKHTQLIYLNNELANFLNLNNNFLQSQEGISYLLGEKNKNTYSQAYAGHQYAYFTMLGDGRAMMVDEHLSSDNTLYDIQLKGSGRTPYSRRGDGKATLSSVLREYIMSEAMHHLHVPTTRSLAVIKTGEKVRREIIHDGGILVRTAQSHIRVGTFQYAVSYGNKEDVKKLADYTILRHYPHLEDHPMKYQQFLDEVIERQAKLVAKWQSIGFVHGVMNTDNVLISGETIDYGPCAFINEYHPNAVFSSIDQDGRYRYQNQPYIASWNMARFAETILDLLSDDKEEALQIANKALTKFGPYFHKYFVEYFDFKLGITNPKEDDFKLIMELLRILESSKSDFTEAFYYLTTGDLKNLPFNKTDAFHEWYTKWINRIGENNLPEARYIMRQHNPVIIPRNEVIQEALDNVTNKNDYTLYDQLLADLKQPFNYKKKYTEKLTNLTTTKNDFVSYCNT